MLRSMAWALARWVTMIHELTLQLRGEVGARQVLNASVAVAKNAGGLKTFDEAPCAVSVRGRCD